jgi:two-component system chemotaxis sensor kinase CheA
MEKIGDPLVHLVRNSLDHGVEMPEVRKAAGKPEVGTIHLNAYHQGGNIVIEITDDGAGLNAERILNKARERGLVGPDEQLTNERIHELIFAPGFSTADQVSDISGRGVGMDVVRRNIKELGGQVEIRSTHGVGTTFSIRLPLTLAILDGQLVRVGDQTYIIPLVSIIESLQVRKDMVNTIAGRAELYRLREQYIPVVRLFSLFGIEPESAELDRGLLVIVESDGHRIGMFVDDLMSDVLKLAVYLIVTSPEFAIQH